MKIGTKSLLYGAHAFWLHPWIVAWAWTKLYGFPFDPRLWVAFIVHDWGYWGRSGMDTPEGEDHVYLGANIMHWLFDYNNSDRWYNFTIYHSRFHSKKHNAQFSKLCVADKLAIVLLPKKIYLTMVKLTGEMWEYMGTQSIINNWYESMKTYLLAWVEEHKDCKKDVWTEVGNHA